MPRIIHIQPDAPSKPALGEPCNGCGVCCLAEPCPLGVAISRKRQGACHALRWSEAEHRYQCGVLVDPQAFLPIGLQWGAPLLVRLARRWIAAGVGCDADMDVARPESDAG